MNDYSHAAANELREIDLVEFLSADTRPTFILERPTTSRSHANSDNNIRKVFFTNKAFREAKNLVTTLLTSSFKLVFLQPSNAQTAAFHSWIESAAYGTSSRYGGVVWTSTIFRQRWQVISGHAASTGPQGPSAQPDREGLSLLGDIHHNKQDTHDATSEDKRQVSSAHATHREAESSPDLSEIVRAFGTIPSQHYRLLQDHDWSNTSIGPIATWPQALRQTMPYLLSSPEPSCIYWGSGRTILYNEAFPMLIGDMHPSALGQSAKVCFASFWPPFEDILQEVERTGAAIRHENVLVPLDRSDHVEEAFFTYTFMPLLNMGGRVCGIYNQAIEVTRQVVSQRQMTTLLKLGNATASAKSLDAFWKALFQSLEVGASDIPFAAVYSIGDQLLPLAGSENGSSRTSRRASRDEISTSLTLEGSTGLTEGHSELPQVLDLSSSLGFASAIQVATTASGSVMMSTDDVSLPPTLLKNLVNRSMSTQCTHVVICPLQLSSVKRAGWLIVGINPLRPYNEDYQGFIHLLAAQIENAATPVILLEKEKQRVVRTMEQAEHQHQWLSEQLQHQTREALESELRFLNFARQAPVGVFILGPDGESKFCNQAWYQLINLSPDVEGNLSWRNSVHPDDLEALDHQWELLKQGTAQTDFEFRIIRGSGAENNSGQEITYLRSSCYPELDDDGHVKSLTGIIMDISVHKAHELVVAERLASALEAKRSQENFMDMVSHEMRNPLNAILQCAEEVSQLLEPHTTNSGEVVQPDTASASLDAINTILYCGRHQKQIIDDVLTISKLDADLLALSPTKTVPLLVLQQVLHIFASDIRTSNIETSITRTEDAQDANRSILMDPGRVLQILINLVGNAIKFLKGRTQRQLSVSVAISPDRPVATGVRFAPSGRQRKQSTELADWGPGQLLYIYFSVTDTGPGLTEDEMNTLFARFRQASPRTHAQYGGSGLGLFISRELAELHGGEIGLISEVDKGSTFAFYVKGRASMQPPTTRIQLSSNTEKESKLTMRGATSVAKNKTLSIVQPEVAAGITVLIVEDNLVNQKVLDRQLKRLGFAVKTANHGEEALSVLQESTWWQDNDSNAVRISVVLCDLEMPVMDGMTCVRQVRDWQRQGLLAATVPMVAVTGNARSEQVRAAREAGFDDVVCKPYSVANLVPLISRLALP